MLTIIKKCNQQIQDSGPNPEFDKLYIYALDPYDAKCWLSINKRECADLKHLNDSKDFINTRMIWMIFLKILKSITHIENVKYY